MVIDYLTAILVFITAIYAYLTHRMTKASEASVEAVRAQSEAMLRPYITAAPFIRPHTSFLYLRVKNNGQTGAQNFSLTIDRNFFQFGEKDRADKNLRTMSAFSTPIDSFPPGAELIFALGRAGYFLAKTHSLTFHPLSLTSLPHMSFLERRPKK